jgi:hypothetical protein
LISWAAFRLLLSGALNAAIKGLSAAFEWLCDDWRNLALAVGWSALLWSQFITVPELRDQIARRDGQIIRVTLERDAEAAAHLGTVDAFLTATKRAQKDAEANVIRVAIEQETVNRETLANLRSDNAVLRARFDRLRASAARAAAGGADAAGLPGSGDGPDGAAGAPGDHNLRAAGELSAQPGCPIGLVCLTIDEAERASQDAARHNRLIDWVLDQSAVIFAPEEPGR